MEPKPEPKPEPKLELELELWSAVRAGQEAQVRLLLERGADPNWRNPEFFLHCPLALACTIRRSSMVALLLTHPDINPNNPQRNGETPLLLACHWGNAQIVRHLLQHPRTDAARANPRGITPLWRACWRGRVEIVKVLLASRRFLDPHRRLAARTGRADDSMQPWNGTTAAEVAERRCFLQVAGLLEVWQRNPTATRARLRCELAWLNQAAQLFALVVCLENGHLTLM